jgi:hypothetical protein
VVLKSNNRGRRRAGAFLLKIGFLNVNSYPFNLGDLEKYQMVKSGFEKTQEEIFQERAEVLYRAGTKLSEAIEKLKFIEEEINVKLEVLRESVKTRTESESRKLFKETNREISRYNKARENASLRHYYLIVTRESMGFRRHKWVDEVYRIPPKKKRLKGLDEQI